LIEFLRRSLQLSLYDGIFNLDRTEEIALLKQAYY